MHTNAEAGLRPLRFLAVISRLVDIKLVELGLLTGQAKKKPASKHTTGTLLYIAPLVR